VIAHNCYSVTSVIPQPFLWKIKIATLHSQEGGKGARYRASKGCQRSSAVGHTHTHTHTQAYTHIHTDTHTHAHAHTHTHTHTLMHTHTRTRRSRDAEEARHEAAEAAVYAARQVRTV
jgi:hypothetical protein